MKSQSIPHFRRLIPLWRKMVLPLRPREPLPSALAQLLPARPAKLLMLGVTPDYAELGADLTALDWSSEMIAEIWPGDTERRRAVLGDWRDMPFADAAFDAAIADNAMAMLAWPGDVDTVLSEVRRVLKPGGVAVFRWFLAPDEAPGDAELKALALSLRGKASDIMRWRFVMHAVHEAGEPTVPVRAAWLKYSQLFPDFGELARANGWDAAELSELDIYRDSTVRFTFPTLAQMRAAAGRHFASIELVPSGDYPLAQFAPFVILSQG